MSTIFIAYLTPSSSETERRTHRNHPRVRSQASVVVENTAARTDDVLHLRLQHPPGRQLRLINHLDHGLAAAHRIEKISEQSDIGIKSASVVTDASVGCRNADLVIWPRRDEAFVDEASVGVKIDQIAIVRHTAGANERGETLVVAAGHAIEHLIDDAVDAAIAGVIEGDAGRLRVGQRQAGIVKALIAEARAGVIPGADAVRAGKSFGVLSLVRQIARLRDEEGAAAKADDGSGRKRCRLIGAVASTGIAAEYRALECPLVRWRDPDAKAGSGKRIGRSSCGKIGGEKRRPADAVVDEVRGRLALQKLAVGRHQPYANGQAFFEVLFVPEGIEARDRTGFQVGDSENIAEIGWTEKRPMGDEAVSVELATLPAEELLQIEIDLRLKNSDPDGARANSAADIGEKVVGIIQRDVHAVALEVGPQSAPIAGQGGGRRRWGRLRSVALCP